MHYAKRPPHELFQDALRFHQMGLLAEAERVYREVVSVQKNNANALNLLGVLCHQTGRSEEGASLVQHAIKLKPGHIDAITNLGNILKDLGHFDNAIGCYEHALSLDPRYAVAHCNLGATLSLIGRNEEAIEHLRQAINILPSLADAHFNLGEALERNSNPTAAIPAFQKFLEYAPQHQMGRLNLADCLKKTGRIDEAMSIYRQLIADSPNLVLAHNNFGNLLRDEGRLDEARSLFESALRLAPDLAELHSNLSAVLISQNQLDKALHHLDIALKLAPERAAIHNNRSAVLLSDNRLAEALQHLDTALSSEPQQAEIHYLRSLALLVRGELEKGFREYEWRWNCRIFRSPLNHSEIQRWMGDALAGRTLLVHTEQGIGDTLQFIRYGRLLRQLAGSTGKIILECPALLNNLLHGVPGFDQIVNSCNGLPPPDLQIPLLSLPHLFKTSLNNIPAEIPYLSSEPQKEKIWQEKLGTAGYTGLRVGLVWAGNKEHANDRNRSMTLTTLESLFSLTDVSFVSLQKGSAEEELQGLSNHASIYPAGGELNDFTDTAALISTLDIIISVDTSVAHLAGALGKPVWMMVPFAPDWRWMMDREDSPWYPTMRLFRQEAATKWGPVIDRIRLALLDTAASRPR